MRGQSANLEVGTFVRLVCGYMQEESSFSISGESNELLFHLGLWDRVNRQCGTIFDQYEEDDASPQVVDVIRQEVLACIRRLADMDAISLRFRYARSEDGSGLHREVVLEDAIRDLNGLAGFLRTAQENAWTLCCCL